MTVFLIVAALLIAGAMLFVLPTLLRKDASVQHALRDEVNLTVLRDQSRELEADFAAGTIDATSYKGARQELERRVAEDVQPDLTVTVAGPDKRWTAGVVGLVLPSVAVSLYLLLGTPAGLDPTNVAAPKEQAHAVTADQIQSMISGLAQRLKNEPENAEGWSMLARSYNALGRYSEAADAYGRLVKLLPGDAGLLADYADTLAMSSNKSLQGEPEKLIARALVVDPKNIKALALSGSAAFERRDFQSAVSQWKKILVIVPPESEIARSTMSSIGEAQAMAGKPMTVDAPVVVAATTSSPAPKSPADAAGAEVGGTVEIDAALRSKVADTDTVFIFARASQGPRFPLAVLRKQVKDLPARFLLDDSMSMVPNAKLSGFPMLVVGARISKSGSATPSAGDLEGVIESVRPGSKGLKVLINSQRP